MKTFIPALTLLLVTVAVAQPPASRTPHDARKGFVAPTIAVTTDPEFPYQLTRKIVDEGEARIMVMIDAQGRLADWFVTGYTHPLFAQNTLEVLPGWTFKPARKNGQPVDARVELSVSFHRSGVLRSITADPEAAMRIRWPERNRRILGQICRDHELDQPLDAIAEVAPMPTFREGAVARQGSVIVDYVVDPEGRVRMPLIVSSDDPVFSDSVLLALSQWRYGTPRRDGKPVYVKTAQRFDFPRLP